MTTTTISKYDLLLAQQQHQQQQQQQKQQQQQLQQPQRSSIFSTKPTTAATATNLLNKSFNSNLFINNTVNNQLNTPTPKTKTCDIQKNTATTTTRLDSQPTFIQIDSLNNNNNNSSRSDHNNINNNNTHPKTTTTTTATHYTVNNNHSRISPDDAPPEKPPKRRSLLNFRSLDFHLKSLYSGLRNGAGGNNKSHSQSQSVAIAGGGGENANVNAIKRMPPYLKIEAVDCDESANLLLDYPQSPYSSRRNSSHDDNRSSSQLLHINSRYEASRSQASSPSPFFLSPYAMDDGSSSNIRRSSTSDIVSCKRSGTSSARDSRRPSTSDLLRKARERRGSEARMGRSVSHGGLPRGGYRGGGAGGRRTSMAF